MNKIRNGHSALLLDIGTGTRDIMLYSKSNSIENNTKIVAPTAARKFANIVEKYEKDLKIAGYTMGGGPLSSALTNHLKKGYKVQIEPRASFTVRNNLEQLISSGFEIVEKIENPDIFFDEIEVDLITGFIENMGAAKPDIGVVGLSVQDHGDHEENESSRRKRFDYFVKLLGEQPNLGSLVFNEKNMPDFFTRMQSGAACIRQSLPEAEIVIMDTCISALAGCWFDENVRKLDGPVLFVNFGNGHTLACVLENEKIHSFYEHHTGLITRNPDRLKNHLNKLVEGRLDFEDVFADGGHGCKTFKPFNFNELAGIVITGPRRQAAGQMGLAGYYEAAPGGDMMMTGPLGLLRGYNLINKAF